MKRFVARALVVVAALLALGVAGPRPADAAADLPRSVTRSRPLPCPDPPKATWKVDVHLWYPADRQEFAGAPGRLYLGVARPAAAQAVEPLSWTVQAEIAGKNAAIDPNSPAFPVIVFSHGNQNDPIDYAHTLELIASAGFVVAAPARTNNTQDDVRIDYINAQAEPDVFECNDKLPPPCSRTNVPFSMADRARDISTVLDKLPGWFEDRVDLSRVGVIGHSPRNRHRARRRRRQRTMEPPTTPPPPTVYRRRNPPPLCAGHWTPTRESTP